MHRVETIFIIAWAVAFNDVDWRGYIGARKPCGQFTLLSKFAQ